MNIFFFIAIYTVFAALITAYLVGRVCISPYRISGDEDFITALIKDRKNKLIRSGIDGALTLYFSSIIILPLTFGFITYLITNKMSFTVIVAVAFILAPEGVIKLAQRHNDRVWEDRYAQSLEYLATALKSGMTIMQAVHEVSTNRFVNTTMRRRFAKLSADLQMGISVKDAFYAFAENTNSPDAKDLAIALDVQNEVGGHESQVVQNIARDIRERIIQRREIKALFAGTSSMVWIMDFIPLGIILFLGITNQTYVDFYFSSPVTMVILLVIVGCCVLGSIINHVKLSRLT